MIRILLMTLLMFALCGCESIFGGGKGEIAAPLPAPSLENIADGVWVHKSYKDVPPWGPVLSQGMAVKTEGGVALVDTAWSDEDTQTLLALIEQAVGQASDIAIITHAHEDKMGGMKTLQEHGIGGRAHPLTNTDAAALSLIHI